MRYITSLPRREFLLFTVLMTDSGNNNSCCATSLSPEEKGEKETHTDRHVLRWAHVVHRERKRCERNLAVVHWFTGTQKTTFTAALCLTVARQFSLPNERTEGQRLAKKDWIIVRNTACRILPVVFSPDFRSRHLISRREGRSFFSMPNMSRVRGSLRPVSCLAPKQRCWLLMSRVPFWQEKQCFHL